MIVHDVEQNSAEWLRLRLGVPTASEFGKVLTPKTMKLSTQSTGYMHRLLGEWMTGEPAYSPETDFMQLGHDLEERAVQAYCLQRECEVEKVGFITNDAGTVGCSPDRIVSGWKGGVEIKTHPAAIGEHVRAMLERSIDPDHRAQTQGQMWLAGLDYVDVVSYCPVLPTVIIRANRDEQFIAALSTAMDAFVELMLKLRETLTQQYGPIKRPVPQAHGMSGMGLSDEDLDAIVRDEFARSSGLASRQ